MKEDMYQAVINCSLCIVLESHARTFSRPGSCSLTWCPLCWNWR